MTESEQRAIAHEEYSQLCQEWFDHRLDTEGFNSITEMVVYHNLQNRNRFMEAGERQFQYGQKLADKMVEIDRLREEVHRQSVVIDSFKRDYPKEFEELMKGFVKG